MTEVQIGDRIRVTFERVNDVWPNGTSVVRTEVREGVVAAFGQGEAILDSDGRVIRFNHYGREDVDTVEVLERASDMEPPVGSVVIVKMKFGPGGSYTLHRQKDGWKELGVDGQAPANITWPGISSFKDSASWDFRLVTP